MKARTAWTPDQIRAYQEQKLRDIIGYCWQYIPFYRGHWRGHVDNPRGRRHNCRPAQAALLTEDQVREHLNALVTTDPKVKSTEAHTGGSTGQAHHL